MAIKREFKTALEAERFYEQYDNPPSGLESARDTAREAQQAALEAKYFWEFFRKHRDVSPVAANELVLRQFLGDIPISPSALEECYVLLINTTDHGGLAILTPQDVVDQDLAERTKLVAAILEFKGSDSSFLENEKKRLNLKNPQTCQYLHPLDELRAILEEEELRAKFRAMSVSELRAIVKPQPQPEFPPIPSKWTGPIIKASAPAQIRTLLRMYGQEQVNARLQEVS